MATTQNEPATANQDTENDNPTVESKSTEKKRKSSPYLSGPDLKNDDGPLLSIFALQEILEKVRETQIRSQIAGTEIETAAPEVKDLLTRLLALKEVKGYKVVRRPPECYRFIPAQSEERLFRVNSFKERISVIGENVECDDGLSLLDVVLSRVRMLRDEGAFILHDIETHYVNGSEVVNADCLGMNINGIFGSLTPARRYTIETQLETFLVINQMNERPMIDTFNAACDDALYKIHEALMNYVESGQINSFKRSLEWLRDYGVAKDIVYDAGYLTDVFSTETKYCLSYSLPADPRVIWEVPRSSISNMIMNAALGFPTGAYISPPARIASVTVTSRITTSSPFAQMQSMVPTEATMNDVRKIYFALCFPNQVLLDIRSEPGHQIDPVIQAVAGVFGKVMFSYGPRLFNITKRTAELLDRGLAQYLQMMTDGRRTIKRGATGAPLDFVIEQGNRQFDCSVLANDPDTGRGFNSSGITAVTRRSTPYPHVSRRICYLGFEAGEVLDERYTGANYRYSFYDQMMDALTQAGHINEKNFLQLALQHHVVRFAYINRTINRDLLSAFTMPDDQFEAMGNGIPQDVYTPEGPVVLDISYLSIWFAFKMRFLPTDRPLLMVQQPLIESVYASHLSMVKLAAQRLMQFVDANPDNFPSIRAPDVWKVVTKEMPEVLHDILDMIGQRHFITMRDVYAWTNSDIIQESLLYVCDVKAWECLLTPSDLMLVKDIFIHSENIPEPVIDDIETFRREANYYTNMRDSLPPVEDRVFMNKSSMLVRAGEGRLKSTIRSMLDAGDYIKVGNSLRPLVIKFFDSMPPQDVREKLPFTYNVEKKDGPMSRIMINLGGKVVGYVLMYSVTKEYTPDQFVSILPSKNLSTIVINPLPFERVEASTVLNVTNKVFMAYRGKVRLVDLTESLQSGTQLASLAASEA
ncbi:VP3(T2) [CHeRI orbivirus 3-3]|uniref:VP3/T2 n=1 Tax=CHeRI orbivirus 3-4 TaxID=2729576 RepID=A0A6M3T0J4_9REOV|nr:VP3(T2) [CHeRI orbivirus 3-1]QCQ85388.1 VP3(T2) [CHeRI orbivirus 3-3]QJD38992.1 VP3/T2 [CHeRI orbivirus 3-4]